MYLVDSNTVLKFGIKKTGKEYIPVLIDGEPKEGTIVFEAKPYSSKDVLIFNSLKDDSAKYEFIKSRTKCSHSVENMIPIILFSVNVMVIGHSIMSEVDESLFI